MEMEQISNAPIKLRGERGFVLDCEMNQVDIGHAISFQSIPWLIEFDSILFMLGLLVAGILGFIYSYCLIYHGRNCFKKERSTTYKVAEKKNDC
jgi:hypothetical protein